MIIDKDELRETLSELERNDYIVFFNDGTWAIYNEDIHIGTNDWQIWNVGEIIFSGIEKVEEKLKERNNE